MAETSRVHCFKFEVLYTLEMLWFKEITPVLISTMLITTRCEKLFFDATKHFGIFFDSQFQ